MTTDSVRTKSHSILLIEDDYEQIRVFGNLLKLGGYSALFATGLEQAKKIIVQKLPRLIILSTYSVNLNGFRVFEELSEHNYMANIPVVFIGPPVEDDLIEDLTTSGNLNYICEPLTLDKLIKAIDTQIKYPIPEPTTEKAIHLRKTEQKRIMSALTSAISSFNHFLNASDREVDKKSKPAELTDRDKNNNAVNVLVVEDNLLNLAFTESVLNDAGYNVIIAGSGKEAIEQIKKIKPNLVLLDMSLPDMTGTEFYQQLISMNIHVPVVVISGYSKTEIHDKFGNFAFSDYLLKPVKNKNLLDMVEKYTGSSRSSQGDAESTNTEYDYSFLREITKNSGKLIKRWFAEFSHLLDACEEDIIKVRQNNTKIPDANVMHGLLNYSVHFGAHHLKELIWAYKNPENARELNKPEILNQMMLEIKKLRRYYTPVMNQYDNQNQG